jgi:hypothetical protein
MSTVATAMTEQISISEFEKFHADGAVLRQEAPSFRELLVTLAVTLFMAPFSFVTFMVIPIMGQVTVGLSVLLTIWYFVSRRSILVPLTAIGGTVMFWGVMFLVIQGIKNNLEVPLFFFTATGIPVSAMYCIYVGTRIWTVRGGLE